ncbi:MAG TPA: hypothetical protein VKN16_21430 [Methylomirabilota bacterium]|jgi:hypothetical protein|nr:hypothetical protein [Methylomirabilota bacterium]
MTRPPGAEVLGLTITAGMLFVMGALGGLLRARVSVTQRTCSRRTLVDLLMGGCGGVLLPIFAPILNKVLFDDFQSWTAVQQSALAFFVGCGGSYVWTLVAWRTGLIVTPTQAAAAAKPGPPEEGILKGPR